MAHSDDSNLINLDTERTKRRGATAMTGKELVDEVVFLLDQGTHPLLIADTMGLKWASILRAAARLGRSDELNRIDLDEWRRWTLPERSGWGYAA
ncbi:hypothetical protein [Microbacterium sp. SORGH_AS_0862]|uniref:hypothetical protein n=1 Tax=Microbacterium sp. SORGH_AS_0862 TaxID=3041789 RepID=UPI002793F1B4|nr:hypothetical protein [Microbacterium sp. SORGH_AS_0862]MDQ1205064.1 hypothetical protein [Microbacterium sp. SORGH_AS_0862]